jgi:putative CocE/NonD family hydrolase
MKLEDLFAHPPQAKYQGIKTESTYLTMRDGTKIAVDILLPVAAETALPTLLIMARYWRSMELRLPEPPNQAPIGPREPIVDYLVPRGFAILVVDARGTGASTGTNRFPWSSDELADYGEVAAWAKEQVWCNGNLGAFGISYEGATALRLASTGQSGIKAVIPQEIEFDVYTDIAIPGGVFNEAFIKMWSASNQSLDSNKPSSLFPFTARLFVKGVRPVDAERKSRPILQQALKEHQANTDVFKAMSGIVYRDDVFGDTGVTLDEFSVFAHKEAIEASGAAIFSWGSWMDGATAEAALRNFNTFSNPQITIIGSWKHEMTADGSPYQKAKSKPNPSQQEQWAAMAQFFDSSLRDDKPILGKKLFYYTIGAERWNFTERFPLPNTKMETWYFQEGIALSPDKPMKEGVDSYTVDFEATTGTQNRWHTQMAQPVNYPNRAKADQRLLSYTSAPLRTDMEITGYPIVTLYLASTESDGAFFVYLEDVDEQGYVRYITEGQLRAIHRKPSQDVPPYWTGMPHHSFLKKDAAPLPKGEVVEMTFALQVISVLVKKGHCLRIAIAGADKDTFAKIPANGNPTIHLHRSANFASMIQLPIIC